MNFKEVTILSGQSLSAAVDLQSSAAIARIEFPSAWTAANLTFQTSADGVTYREYLDATGAAVTVNGGADRIVGIDAVLFDGLRFLKVRSGTSGVPVSQGADRVLRLLLLERS